MQITFRRNGLKNYMVIRNDRNETAGLHEKMIIRNQISHLARMTPQSIDGYSYYYYDIQGKVSLDALFEGRSMTKEEMAALLHGLSEFLFELERYLLSPDEVLFAPEAVWVTPDTLDPSFIYVPGLIKDDLYGIRALAEFLTEHTDSSDREAAAMAYEYLAMVETGSIRPEIPHGISPGEQEMGCKREDIPGIPDGDRWDIKEGISEEMKPFFEDTEEERPGLNRRKLSYILIGAVMLLAGIYILLVLCPEIFPFYLNDEEYMTAGVVIAIIFAIVLAAVMYMSTGRKTETKEEPESEEPIYEPYEDAGEDELDHMEYEREKDVDDEKTTLLKRPVFSGAPRSSPSLTYDSGRRIMIGRFPFMLGKMKNRVDEVVEGAGVSRIHAMLKEQDGRYFLSDLNSLNGTLLNGRMLDANETAEIHDGDVITLAETSLTFQG